MPLFSTPFLGPPLCVCVCLCCSFRSVDPFDLWLWLELYRPPSHSDLEMLQVGGLRGCGGAAIAAAIAAAALSCNDGAGGT